MRLLCCLCCAMLFTLVGCGKSEKTISVKGKVLVDGQPLTFGVVIFSPDAAKGNTSAHEPRGMIDENGLYEVFQTKDQAGVTPGWYKISFSAQRLKDPKNPYSYESVIPDKYTSPRTSGFAVEVVANPEPGKYDFPLQGRKP